MTPLLLDYKTKMHYLAFEKNLVVLVYFLKFILDLYLTPLTPYLTPNVFKVYKRNGQEQ